MMQADDVPSLSQNAREKKKELEHTTTALMRKALKAETEKLRETADNHTAAWKVLSKLKGGPAQCPIMTEKLVEHFSSIAKPRRISSSVSAGPRHRRHDK
jgi:hypothetical protein